MTLQKRIEILEKRINKIERKVLKEDVIHPKAAFPKSKKYQKELQRYNMKKLIQGIK
jgi:hypothetical protein